MKTQKVTKSSKFTQATPNDNEYRDYQNIGLTLLPVTSVDDGTNQNIERISYVEGHCHNVNQSSELLLKGYEGYKIQESMHEIQRFSPVERNANRFPQEIEMCNCSATAAYPPKTRFADQCKSDHPATLNRSFTSLPKLESSLSQASLDRKAGKYPTQQRAKHTYVCEQNQRILRELEKTASLRRMQSPEIINIHRGPFYEGHGVENCAIKDFKCDDHGGFRRGHSVRTVGSRPSILQSGHHKGRLAGDGMDAEMDDPEVMFEMSTSHHLGDCQCACDHVVYSPTAYTTCLQIVGPAEIEILSISNCHGLDDKDLHLRLNVNTAPGYALTISGNGSAGLESDDVAEINSEVGPAEIEILSISNCHGLDDKDLHLRLNVNTAPGYALTISGNGSAGLESDDVAEINSEGSSFVEGNKQRKKAIYPCAENKNVCWEIREKHTDAPTDAVGRDNLQSICPTSELYEIKGVTLFAPHGGEFGRGYDQKQQSSCLEWI